MADEPYSVDITETAKKRLLRQKHAEAQILRATLVPKADPRAGHELAVKLHGYRSLKIFAKGSGEYWAINRIVEEASTVVIHWIGPAKTSRTRLRDTRLVDGGLPSLTDTQVELMDITSDQSRRSRHRQGARIGDCNSDIPLTLLLQVSML